MTRRILAILFAIALAVFGTAAVLLYVKRADDRAVAEMSPVDVLVAKDRVPAGTTGESIRTRELVQVVQLPAGSVPVDEVLTRIPTDLDKLVVTSDLQPGQVVLRRMFSAQTRTAGGLAIPEGKIAVSFEASMAEQVAGYVRPGSQIAVFASYTLAPDGRTKVLGSGSGGTGIRGTALLLQKVEVIAVGAHGEGATTTTPIDGDEHGESGQQGGASVLVTVAVSAEDGARLIQAAEGNALYLALLNDSSEVKPGVGVDSRTLFG